MPNLDRFIEAQNRPHDGFESALRELSSTGKQRHWIWYIFPQLADLGHSSMSQRCEDGYPECQRTLQYLRDDNLGDQD
jgi:uncharacterized protein (DUF1810 family)